MNTPSTFSLPTFLKTETDQSITLTFLELLAEKMRQLESQKSGEAVRLLKEENRALKNQLSRFNRPTPVQLLPFLPIFFIDFWNTLKPVDLAALVGEIHLSESELPHLQEAPSIATILSMKKAYVQLHPEDKTQLKHFCLQLKTSHGLQFHPEIAPLFVEK